MKLVFGLGNPGQEYAKTRHNTGFMALDTFAKENKGEFGEKAKFFALVAETQIGDEKVLLVKPGTFYNEIGRSYRAVLDFYKIDPSDTLIVHDELALPFGTIRSRVGGADAGNNGIKSVNRHGGETSARLRVGIANEQRAVLGDTDFVLAAFSKDEAQKLQDVLLPKLTELINDFVTDNHVVTSHKFDSTE